jgi:hypothetical protein
MVQESCAHIITAEEARRFFESLTGDMESDVSILLEAPEEGPYDAAECHIIIGSSIVSFLGSREARTALEKLLCTRTPHQKAQPSLFFG